MATGTGAVSGDSLESTLTRRFQNVSNTMDSIQGLSTWCIDNKKYHSLIVRHWIKCMRKSNSSHRLNLFYLVNDVIQNCKRKNAIVYRTAFAEVLRDACMLINLDGDQKVIKSVERILSIWEDRGVYSGSLITELRSKLVKEESPDTPAEQQTPVESKADLRSKIVAEFVPQTLIDELCRYKKSLEEVDLREKQLAAMRIDICSSANLKKLKDKAGGKKFSKDFEEGSAQLQEFIKFLNNHCKKETPLMEVLNNADIFYEMQYKEVKIVANAYQAFANRVSHLKRKLDALKSTVPDLDESPIPSPSADAPSPTGSESPFRGMEMEIPNLCLDGSAVDDEAEPPAPSPLSSLGMSPKHPEKPGHGDNRIVEDMELSDEEADSVGIIVEEQNERPSIPVVSTSFPAKTEPSVATEQPVTHLTASSSDAAASVDNIDLAKIGSILNSLSSVINDTVEPKVESPPTASLADSLVKTTPADSIASQDATSLVNLLSKVDVSPADLISALSKVQGQSSFDGISSLMTSPAENVSQDSSISGKAPLTTSSTSASLVPCQSLSISSVAPMPSSSCSTVSQITDTQAPTQTSNPASALIQALHRDMDLTTEPEPSLFAESLESKIHNFLQGNSAFNAFDLGFPAHTGDNLSPVTGADTQDGTPVRDEGGGTPTQDEIMDKPAVAPFTPNTTIGETFETVHTAYQNNSQQNLKNLQQQSQSQPPVTQSGQFYQQHLYGNNEMSELGVTAPVAQYQRVSAQTGGLGESAPGSACSTQTGDPFQMMSDRGWYNDRYPEGNSLQLGDYNAIAPRGAEESNTPGLYPYQAEQAQQPHAMASQQGASASSGFFRNTLPPVPNIPPPPQVFENTHPVTSTAMMSQEPQLHTDIEEVGARVDSVISGMVVHDHQHKSMFQPDDPMYNCDEPRPPHPMDLHPHPDNLHYQERLEYYHNEPQHSDAHFGEDDSYPHPDNSYHRPPRTGSPPHHYPRIRGHFAPPVSSSEDPYFANDYHRHGPPPPRYAVRRPPPHFEMRHPGLRPPPRPPHLLHPMRPRGPPRAPFPQFHGPEPRLRGKRPGPIGRGNAGPMFAPKRPFPPPRY